MGPSCKWQPGLLCPLLLQALACTRPECPQETGYLSPGGGASGFPFAAPARMFCNEFGESIHSGKNPGVECFLPAGVWVRGRRAASWAGAGWGGGEMGRGWCWLPDWPSPQPSGTLAAFKLFFCLSACPSGLEKLAGSG